MVERSYMI